MCFEVNFNPNVPCYQHTTQFTSTLEVPVVLCATVFLEMTGLNHLPQAMPFFLFEISPSNFTLSGKMMQTVIMFTRNPTYFTLGYIPVIFKLHLICRKVHKILELSTCPRGHVYNIRAN